MCVCVESEPGVGGIVMRMASGKQNKILQMTRVTINQIDLPENNYGLDSNTGRIPVQTEVAFEKKPTKKKQKIRSDLVCRGKGKSDSGHLESLCEQSLILVCFFFFK